MNDFTYYTVVGIPETATQDEIRRAYGELIRHVHHDKFPDDSLEWKLTVEEKSKEIIEAYQMLSNSNQHSSYDQPLSLLSPWYTWLRIVSGSSTDTQTFQRKVGVATVVQQTGGKSLEPSITEPAYRLEDVASYYRAPDGLLGCSGNLGRELFRLGTQEISGRGLDRSSKCPPSKLDSST